MEFPLIASLKEELQVFFKDVCSSNQNRCLIYISAVTDLTPMMALLLISI